MTNALLLRSPRALFAAFAVSLASCAAPPDTAEDPPDRDADPAIGAHAAAITPALLPACTQRRWVGVSSAPGVCPAAPAGWTGGLVFPNAVGTQPGLGVYCVYEWGGPPGPPPPAHLAALDAALSAGGVGHVEEDCVVVGPLATPDDHRTWARERLLERAGAFGALPGGVPVPVRVAVADSSPDAPQSISLGLLPHGHTMGWIAKDIACPGNGLCAGRVAMHLALPRVTNETVDPVGGGLFGTRIELARAIYDAVEAWSGADGGEPRLVINLSVGWEPDAGCGDPSKPASMTTTQHAVLAAITHASCHGALVIAAAGNDPGGAEPLHPAGTPGAVGPTCPAAWSKVPSPGRGACEKLEGPDYEPGSPALPALYVRPESPPEVPVDASLLYAVGGVDHADRPITRSRRLGSPRLAAIALQGPNGDPASPLPQPLTGTSVAAAVTSGIAATVWAYRPELTGPEIMSIVYEAGLALSRSADFAPDGVSPEVRRVSLCHALTLACAEDTRGARCPTKPFTCALPPPTGGLQTPPLGADVLAFFDATFEAATQYSFTPGEDATNPASTHRSLAAAPWVSPQPDRPPCGACVFSSVDDTLSVQIDASYPSNLQLSRMTLTLTGPRARDSSQIATVVFRPESPVTMDRTTAAFEITGLAWSELASIQTATLSWLATDVMSGESGSVSEQILLR